LARFFSVRALNSFVMNQSLETNGPDMAQLPPGVLLNFALGRRVAFSTVGGRCSAAHVEIIRRIRTQKLYLAESDSWAAFCPARLGISRRSADRLIALLTRFGPAYFELAELLGITPEQYEILEPAISAGRLHADGESISMVPANCDELEAAIDRMLEAAPSARQPAPFQKRLTRAASRARNLVRQLRDLHQEAGSDDTRDEVSRLAAAISEAFLRLDPDSLRVPRGA
jgi:hypothetical protein